MRRITVCESTYVYQFDELRPYETTVTVLLRQAHAFVFDTFLGTRYMRAVFSDLRDAIGERETIVINSHAHFDHVWGNSFFQDAPIVGSALCREMLLTQWDAQVAAYPAYADSDLVPRPPDQLLTDARVYEQDGVVIFPSPGHTADSVSLYDESGGLLLVGDNVERPLVQVEAADLAGYADTLRRYLALEPRHIVGGHNAVLTRADIQDTLQYLTDLQNCTPRAFSDPAAKRVHRKNLEFLRQTKTE